MNTNQKPESNAFAWNWLFAVATWRMRNCFRQIVYYYFLYFKLLFLKKIVKVCFKSLVTEVSDRIGNCGKTTPIYFPKCHSTLLNYLLWPIYFEYFIFVGFTLPIWGLAFFEWMPSRCQIRFEPYGGEKVPLIWAHHQPSLNEW